MTRSATILLLAVAAFRAQGQDPDAALLPGRVLFYATIPSVSGLAKKLRGLPAAAVLQNEEVRVFLQGIGPRLREALPEGAGPGLLDRILAFPDLYPGSVTLAVVPGRRRHDPDLLLVLRAARDEDARLAELEPFKSFPIREREEGEGWRVTKLRGHRGTLFLAEAGKTAILSSDRGLLDPWLGGKPPERSLATSESFRAARQELPADLFIHLDLAVAFEEEPDARRELSQLLGGTRLVSLSGALRLEAASARDRILFRWGGDPEGLLGALLDRPLPLDAAAPAPPDALAFAGGRANLPRLVEAVLGLREDRPAEGIAGLKRELERRISRETLGELSGHLGEEALLFATLPETGGLIPDVAALLEVRDPRKLQTAIREAVRSLAGEELSEAPYKGRRIFYLPSAGRRAGAPGFAYTFIDDRLALGMTPISLKRLIARDEAGKGGLDDDEAFREAAGKLPEGAAGIVYVNTRRTVEYVHGLVVPLLQMFAGGSGDLPFDPALFPTAEAFAGPFRFTVGGFRPGTGRVEADFFSEGLSPMMGLLAGGAAGLLFAASDVARPDPWQKELGHVREAAEAYRKAHGRPHERLSDLVPHAPRGAWTWNWRDDGPLVDVHAERGKARPETPPPDAILYYLRQPDRHGGHFVLRGDGRVVWLPREDVEAILKRGEGDGGR